MVVVHNRDHPGNLQNSYSNIMHAKNRLERQELAQKASQTFFGNTSAKH